MGLRITVWPHQLSPGWTGNMQWELNRREAEWRVLEGGCRLDCHARAKPLGGLLVDARYDNLYRDHLASRDIGVGFSSKGGAILLDWKPKPMLILPED